MIATTYTTSTDADYYTNEESTVLWVKGSGTEIIRTTHTSDPASEQEEEEKTVIFEKKKFQIVKKMRIKELDKPRIHSKLDRHRYRLYRR